MGRKIDILMVIPRPLGRDGFSFGVAILAAILKKGNFSVGVVDANSKGMNVADTAEQIVKINPKIVGFTGLWVNFLFQKEVAKLVRQKLPSVKLLAGGWWANTVPEIVLRETDIDYIVKGEADLVIENICEKLLDEKSVLDVPGLCSLNDKGEFCENESLPPNSNLDDLLIPAYELFDMDYYIWDVDKGTILNKLLDLGILRKRMGNKRILKSCQMFSGRGCYGRCTFCGAAGLPRRNHSPKYVVDHMEKMNKEYGVEIFSFNESLTLTTNKWVKAFCNEIISRRLNFIYFATSRVDFRYDEEVISLLSESGCYALFVGFESGNNDMLRSMKKKVSVELGHKMINDFRRHNISISGSFILNMPGETERSLQDTITFVKQSKLHTIISGFASPYPQTELYEYAKKKGFIKDELDLISKNPGINKGRDNFSEYINSFDFNNLSHTKLISTKKILDRFNIINKFYSRNKLVYWTLRLSPSFTVIILAFQRLTRAVRFLVRYGLKAFIAKIASKLK